VAELSQQQAEQVRAALHGALPESEQDGLVTRWAAIVETTNTDGKRSLHRLAEPAMTEWDAWGFLTYATMAPAWWEDDD
jgi:hypothetical protein